MNVKWTITIVSAACSLCISCQRGSAEERYIREIIPVKVQAGRKVCFENSGLSGNGVNDVCIRCPREVWRLLAMDLTGMTVRVESLEGKKIEVGGVAPGSGGTSFEGIVSNAHYLFYLTGNQNAKGKVIIFFPNGPQLAQDAEIIVLKTPSDTGL